MYSRSAGGNGSKLRKNIDLCTILRYFNNTRNIGMRCLTLIFLALFVTVLTGGKCFSQEKISITKVVIDAGHGGKDPGTIGKKSQEKNIALQIALKLADMVREQCPDVTVLCTRTTDEFVELHERAEIANRSRADLFISIHCNANPSSVFHGAETYIMGLHRTEANLEIAKKENVSILMEPDYSTNYNGFDPNTDESYITFTLFQNAFLDQSTEFASDVQDEMKDRVGMDDRGVRQAGFLVLYKTTMPSVLVETGFLSNPEEEKFLISQKGQQYIAGAICRAFRKFKAKIEGSGTEIAALKENPEPPLRTRETTPSQVTENAGAAEKTKEPPVTTDSVKPVRKPLEVKSSQDSIKARKQAEHTPAIKEKEKPKNQVPKKDTVIKKEPHSATPIPKEKPKSQPAKKDTIIKKEDHTAAQVRNEKPKNQSQKKDSVLKKEQHSATPIPKEKPKSQPQKKDSVLKKEQHSTTPIPKEKPKSQPAKKDTIVKKEDHAAKQERNEKPKNQSQKKDSVLKKEQHATTPIPKEKPKEIIPLQEKHKTEIAAKNPVKPVEKNNTRAVATGEVIFRIQITSISKDISVHDKKFSGLSDVWSYQKDNAFKYTAGRETTLEGAKSLLDEVRKKGFPDAFIVAFYKGERITIDEAKNILSDKNPVK